MVCLWQKIRIGMFMNQSLIGEVFDMSNTSHLHANLTFQIKISA
jgi:hypothetical protein